MFVRKYLEDNMEKITDVGRKLTKSNRILVETAVKYGVKVEKIPGEKRRFKMSYGTKNYIIKKGYVTNAFNHRLALRLCRQKDVINSYLISRNFPAPENATFKKGEELRAWCWAKDILPIVLKPVDGSLGKMVYVKITEKEEFIELFNKIAEKHTRVLVEEYKRGIDYRALIVNNEIVAILNRVPANVVGDGKSTIKELIVEKNKIRKDHLVLKQLKMDDESKRNIKKLNYTFESVPQKDERIFLRTNANISDGADSYDVTNLVSNEIKDILTKAVKSIPGLNIVGVDVLIHEDKVNIIELNANPMINIHYHTSCGNGREVGKQILKAMFPELII